jgi:hypothetical protein
MSDIGESSNPFATRFTRPGAIQFLFAAGESAQAVVDRLREHAWQGEIVGPHGAGKSTLLATLSEPLSAAGRTIVLATLHQGESSLPAVLEDWRCWSASTQVIVDGYEQLSWWSRRRLAQRIRDRQAGVLVTSHAPTGLPTVMTVAPRIEAVQQIVRQLVPDGNRITRDDIERLFSACDGNIREMLFQLYDVYQDRSREDRPEELA